MRGERERKGEGKEPRRKEKGKRRSTYKAATTTVFFPLMLAVNSAPMVVMSFLMYSRSLPV